MNLQPAICIFILATYIATVVNGCQQHIDLNEIKNEIVKVRKVEK